MKARKTQEVTLTMTIEEAEWLMCDMAPSEARKNMVDSKHMLFFETIRLALKNGSSEVTPA